MVQRMMEYPEYQVGGRTFSNPPLARPTDPDTSHEAAVEVAGKLSELQLKVVEIVARFGPLTASEIGAKAHELYGTNAETARKRCRECVRHNRLVEGDPRPCRVTGKNATTYAARPGTADHA